MENFRTSFQSKYINVKKKKKKWQRGSNTGILSMRTTTPERAPSIILWCIRRQTPCCFKDAISACDEGIIASIHHMSQRGAGLETV